MSGQRSWAPCRCGCAPAAHQAVVLQPICIDHGKRVLFEGTLGGCRDCDCELYVHPAYAEAPGGAGEAQEG